MSWKSWKGFASPGEQLYHAFLRDVGLAEFAAGFPAEAVIVAAAGGQETAARSQTGEVVYNLRCISIVVNLHPDKARLNQFIEEALKFRDICRVGKYREAARLQY